MTNKNSCDICGSKSYNKLPLYKKDYLCECDNCGFAFSYKVPTDKELSKVYKNYDREIKLTKDSINNIEKLVKWKIKKFKINSVLDIGCGNGEYLDAAKSQKLKTFFSEFDDKELISKLKKKHSFVDGGMYPFSKKKFDLVTLTELIEHTITPNEIIKNIYNLQNKGGLIYITTPNYNSLEKKLLRNNSATFLYPEHLSYFTSKTLDKLLTQNNYKKVYNYSDNISLFIILNSIKAKFFLKYNVDKISDNAQFVAKRTGLIFIKKIISKILQLLGLGSNLKAIYIRN